MIGDVTQAAYLGPWLWKADGREGRQLRHRQDRRGLARHRAQDARPKATCKLHENHHLWSKTRIGQAQPDGQFKVVSEIAELIEPDPFPKGYQ